MTALLAGFAGWRVGVSRQPKQGNDQAEQLIQLSKTLDKNHHEIQVFAKQMSQANEQMLSAQHRTNTVSFF